MTAADNSAVVPWREAMEQALYGPGGFFVRHAPRAHFRTSTVASPLFASAVAGVVERVDEMLGSPAVLDIVDVGAGRGELLTGVGPALPPGLRSRARFTAVERAPRPDGLPRWIGWRARPPSGITGLLVATEWLDNVPVDVAERDDAGERRLVLVDPATGAEAPGGAVTATDAAWLDRWWPLREAGLRAEVGHTRDTAWAQAVGGLTRGAALTVDYGHVTAARPVAGTLTGYRYGRQVPPVPDGSCDVTAHVAMDAVAAAGERVAGCAPQLLDQRTALRRLGVAGTRPPLTLATTDPAGYVRALAAASRAAELTDADGLGAHYWLIQPVGMPAGWTPLADAG
ncbi:MAG: SAM-dependent methyltransferase [Micromonosporaceae bacterium]